MKKALYTFLAVSILFFCSCSSGGDGASPTIHNLHGTWQYDSWIFNGDPLLNDYTAYLFVCEDQKSWATEIYDLTGNITNSSSAGIFTLNNEKTEGTFTVERIYDALNGEWLTLSLPQTISVTIIKLDDNELDFSMEYGSNFEIIKSVKTPAEPPCSGEIFGCTNILAINYNSSATTDDGSCLYQCDDSLARNYLVTTTYPICEYEADVVFYLDVPAAQFFTDESVPYLDVFVGNDLAGSMPANVGFLSTVLCDDINPEPVHFTYQWEDAQSTTLPWTVRDGTGHIWYDGTDAIICNNCLSLQLTYKKIKEYQDSH